MRQIARNLRESDNEEVLASSGKNPATVIKESWDMSTRRWIVMMCEDKVNVPVALFGVVVLPDKQHHIGVPWMVATNDMNKIGTFIAKKSMHYIEEMKKGLNYLYIYVDTRNRTSINWLERCGFTIHEAKPFGFAKKDFHLADMRF
jgi:RimJ/RimL family protein N-acetyltransferase